MFLRSITKMRLPASVVLKRNVANSKATPEVFGPIKLYGFPLSQPTRSLLLLCKFENIPYEFVLIDALKGENRKFEYTKINPAGLVPAIQEQDGFVLGETAAILIHLSETRKLTDWYPLDPTLRAKVNFWLHWHHGNTRVSTKGILVNVLFPHTGAEEKIAAGKKSLSKSLSFLDKSLEGRDNLVCNQPTIADLMILCELDQLKEEAFGLFDFSPYPNVKKWLERWKFSSVYISVFAPVVEVSKKIAKKN